jgi:hypothetical protein
MKVLICGSRESSKIPDIYAFLVGQELDKLKLSSDVRWKDFEIVEGCCLNSADEYAERWAEKNSVKVNHYPSTSGNYLKRNIKMVEAADQVIAFWDFWSYGTSFVISRAVAKGIPVKIIRIGDKS